jgi:hypothetical protein
VVKAAAVVQKAIENSELCMPWHEIRSFVQRRGRV